VVRGTFGGGAKVPFLPAARIGGTFRFDDGKWSAGTEVRHAFAQNNVSGGDVDVPTAAYTLVNLSAGYQVILGGVVHSLTVRVDNAGDARYFDASSRIKSFAANPGRSVGVVWRVLF
jgi:iron complex outermembrane receptor protein